MLGKLVPAIFAWLVVIITLALAPTIETYNGYITTNITAATNVSYMVGMTVIDTYGGFLIILSLLLGGGFFAVQSRKSSATIGDMLEVIGSIIITVFVLSVYSASLIGYFDALITAGSGVAKTVYGAFPIITYALIIGGGGGYAAYKGYRKRKGSKKSAGYM